MATYVLIHGGGDSAFHWHLLEPELRARGRGVISMDLPCEDDSAGLAEYADAVVKAIGGRSELIVVAQSLGGFTAPLVCTRVPVELIVLIAGMVPVPGERGEDWPANTGYPGPRGASEREIFYDDVPADLVAQAARHSRRQSDTPGTDAWPLDAWPDVPTRYLLCRKDRMFPADWLREVVRTRLGIEPDEIDSGHCPALSRPRELAERLEAYRTELGLP
ncbi:MAG TPA: alpha/beta hydrolase [Solirubrobacterales bacterium]